MDQIGLFSFDDYPFIDSNTHEYENMAANNSWLKLIIL